MKKPKLENIDLDAFSKKMHSESDRVCVILGAALLDEKLKNLFYKRFRSFQDELLSESGPIGTFAARIRLANALMWISDPVQKDLNTIRGMRNDFAHSIDHELSFQVDSIKDRCANLCVALSYLKGYDDAVEASEWDSSKRTLTHIKKKFEAPRWRFQISVEFISQYLDEILEETIKYKPGERIEFDGPDLLKEVHELSSKLRAQGLSITSI